MNERDRAVKEAEEAIRREWKDAMDVILPRFANAADREAFDLFARELGIWRLEVEPARPIADVRIFLERSFRQFVDPAGDVELVH